MSPNRPDRGRHEERDQLRAILDRMAGRRVLVVGDIVADEFIYGRVARVSREAPVLILEYDATEIVPGSAGNAANNVAALGGRVLLAGALGRDGEAAALVERLHPGVDSTAVLRPGGAFRTPKKTRILAGGVHSAKQQIVRIDRRADAGLDASERDRLARRVSTRLGRMDAVIFSDYGGGVVTPSLVRGVVGDLRRRRRTIPLMLDTRYALTRYHGMTAATPNESEVERVLDVRIDDDPRVLERAGRQVLERTHMAALLITRGSKGMALFEPDRPTVHIPISGSDEVADVTGAGDTVIAAMTLALAAGATFEQAARLANHAGGLVVMKRGTATVSRDELARAIDR